MFIGYAGGAALDGHDGWLTYCGPANGGLINLDSIEVDESMYPIIIESRGVRPDTQGYGEFEGAPGVECVFYPVDHAMTIIYAADGTTFAPKGVNGGMPASQQLDPEAEHGRVSAELPAFHQEVCEPGRRWSASPAAVADTAIRRDETRDRVVCDRQPRLADRRQGKRNLRCVPSLR